MGNFRSTIIPPTAVALAALAAYASSAGGQAVVQIDDERECTDCRVELERIVTLHPPSDRVWFTVLPTPGIARDGQGRYLAGGLQGEAPIAVFEPSGTLSHLFGRFGQGPGEFSDGPGPHVHVGTNDTVHVFQSVTHTVLSPGAREVLRTQRLRVRPWCVTLLGRTVVACAAVRAPRAESTPLQVLAENGAVARGIGLLANRPLDFTNPLDTSRRIARARGGDAVWSAQRIRYEISRFDLDGREQASVVREAPWFPPRDDFVQGEGRRTRQRPIIEGVRESAEDTLWVVISQADPAYEPWEPTPNEPEGPDLDPYQDDNARLHTVIEVLDVRAGRLLARVEVDPYLRFVENPDDDPLLFSLRTLETGEVVVDIWQAQLSTR